MSETVNEAREVLSGNEIQELWSSLTPGARLSAFKALSRAEAEDCFWNLSAPDQVELLLELPPPATLPAEPDAVVVKVTRATEGWLLSTAVYVELAAKFPLSMS